MTKKTIITRKELKTSLFNDEEMMNESLKDLEDLLVFLNEKSCSSCVYHYRCERAEEAYNQNLCEFIRHFLKETE